MNVCAQPYNKYSVKALYCRIKDNQCGKLQLVLTSTRSVCCSLAGMIWHCFICRINTTFIYSYINHITSLRIRNDSALIWHESYKVNSPWRSGITTEMNGTHDDVIKWKHFPRYWPFVREFTGHRWIPLTKASNAELWCFFYLCLNKRLNKQSWGWWFETPCCSLWRHCNAYWWYYNLVVNFVVMLVLPNEASPSMSMLWQNSSQRHQ